MGFKRHREAGEPTHVQVMESHDWVLQGGFWVKDINGDLRKLSAGLVLRLWEEQGPRNLERTVRAKEAE